MIKKDWVKGELSNEGCVCSDLAGGSARLQETLVDGVLQELLVVTGHGRVSTAASSVVTVRHLEH